MSAYPKRVGGQPGVPDPELVSQLKEELPPALFEKLNSSLSIVQDRLKFAEYRVRVLEERLRLVRIEKYGPGSEKLSDDQLELLELEPGVSSAEVEAESQRKQLQLPLKTAPLEQRNLQLRAAYGSAVDRSFSPGLFGDLIQYFLTEVDPGTRRRTIAVALSEKLTNYRSR